MKKSALWMQKLIEIPVLTGIPLMPGNPGTPIIPCNKKLHIHFNKQRIQDKVLIWGNEKIVLRNVSNISGTNIGGNSQSVKWVHWERLLFKINLISLLS